MEKAFFSEKQAIVSILRFEDRTQYTICLNEKEQETSYPYMDGNENKVIQYEYDFNQFYDNTVDENDVKEHPEQYLDYVPKQAVSETKTTTVEDRLSVLEEAVQDIALALMGE